MNGDHGDTGSLRPAGEFGGIEQGIIPAQPGFQRNRHVNRAHHRIDQGQRMIQIAHQR